MRRLFPFLSALLFAVGVASLAATLYLWFGDWPRKTRELVDHQRAEVANDARPPDPLIANPYARAPQSLGGTWQVVIDPYGSAGIAGLAPRDARPETPSDLAEFGFSDDQTLRVPGDWNTQDPRLVFYRGTVWYKRTFAAAPAPGTRQFLYFGAAHYRASVYLNGELLGRHEGGFTPFNFEVTDRLKRGRNLLVVRVDNDKAPDDVPTPVTDWLNYGGLTRDVLLLEVPRLFVRTWEVALGHASLSQVRAEVQIDGGPTDEDVLLSIPELGVEATGAADDDGVARFLFDARPELWSPESPRLYRIEIQVADDRVTDEVGFRRVEVDGARILLNGEPIFLRGISLHDEAGLGAGRVVDEEGARRLLGWARELGCNFVRLSHYPHPEVTVRLAERLGLLVWEEIPVYWNVDFESGRTLAVAKAQLAEMIERDRNRAAVIVWGIGNETPQTGERLRFMTALADEVRDLDRTRLVSAALVTGREALQPFVLGYYLPALLGLVRSEWVFRVEDPLIEAVDVAAVNEYFGWYYSGAIGVLGPFSSRYTRRVMLDNMHRIRFDVAGGKPLLVSELGAGALAGMHAPEGDLAVFSEEYQALVYRRQLAMLDAQPGLAGLSPWVLKDFRSPLRMNPGVQDHWNRKGLVADDGTRKQAFDVLREYYELRRSEAAQGS